MATINTADCTFCVVDDDATWANNVGWGTCEFVLRYLKKNATRTEQFKVWVVQDGIVTHMVPFERFCEIANI